VKFIAVFRQCLEKTSHIASRDHRGQLVTRIRATPALGRAELLCTCAHEQSVRAVHSARSWRVINEKLFQKRHSARTPKTPCGDTSGVRIATCVGPQALFDKVFYN
jgi:hypothetical protein